MFNLFIHVSRRALNTAKSTLRFVQQQTIKIRFQFPLFFNPPAFVVGIAFDARELSVVTFELSSPLELKLAENLP